ncbi:MAG: DNA recombination protein RmuC [Kineosporiaceae bacterium]
MDTTALLVALLVVAALAAGAAAGALVARAVLLPRLADARAEAREADSVAEAARAEARLAGERAHAAEVARAEAVGQRDAALAQASASEASAREAGALTAALGPLGERLTAIARQVAEMERDRSSASGRLAEQIRTVQQMGEGLREQTATLAGALRSSNTRGTWGEVQLRRIVEAAGMVQRVDFDVQATMTGPDGTTVRPDMVVRLPDGRCVVVDAKAPLAVPGDGADADAAAADQARKLRAHVTALSAKRYWAGVAATPEFVVCFVPAESILSTAVAADPGLLEDAMTAKVVVVTPVTLLALLRTVAMTWREQAVHENAEQMLDLGRQLYDRLGTVAGHADKLGRSLDRAVGAYNTFVGSFEGRLLVTARRMNDLGLSGDVAAPPLVERDARAFVAPELVAAPRDELGTMDVFGEAADLNGLDRAEDDAGDDLDDSRDELLERAVRELRAVTGRGTGDAGRAAS